MNMDIKTLSKFKKCDGCRKKPAVFITVELIPVCDKHWGWLANAKIEW